MPPGTGMDRPGPVERVSSEPIAEAPPGKASSPSYSKWTLMGRKRLEQKALAFAGLRGFAEEKWLPPTSPLPLSATRRFVKRDESLESYVFSKEKDIGHGAQGKISAF